MKRTQEITGMSRTYIYGHLGDDTNRSAADQDRQSITVARVGTV